MNDNCEIIHGLVDEYIDGELEDRQVVMLESHLDECAECRKYYAEQKKLSGIIRSSAYTPAKDLYTDINKKLNTGKKNTVIRRMVSAVAACFIVATAVFAYNFIGNNLSADTVCNAEEDCAEYNGLSDDAEIENEFDFSDGNDDYCTQVECGEDENLSDTDYLYSLAVEYAGKSRADEIGYAVFMPSDYNLTTDGGELLYSDEYSAVYLFEYSEQLWKTLCEDSVANVSGDGESSGDMIMVVVYKN